ncbi:MAG: response regulator [Deltaproteobacteria bacterium]|jgi:CheY-like chemotaxis protein|nr:response regulator [Deltaproteobacteria bacterium]
MKTKTKPITILMADDDPDDRLLAKEAFEESRLKNDLYFVEDGVELLDFLHRRDKFSDAGSSPKPGLILLDLNMPRKDGREALEEIKSDACFRRIPIVVLTTSNAEEDIIRSYELGVSAYIRKPVTFEGLTSVIRSTGKFFIEIVELPPVLD